MIQEDLHEMPSLKVLYTRLYSLSLDQGKMVGEVGGWEDGRWRWRLNWIRDRYKWESNLEENMFLSLNMGVICKDSHDHLVWRKDPTGIFSVKSAYSILANHQATSTMEGVYSILWQAKASPKALLTAWRVLHDRIPTIVNLIRRGVSVISPLCALCSLSKESSQHLFLDCVVAQRVWSRCCRWIGILGVQNKDIRNHMVNFHLIHLSSKQNQVWTGLWAAIVMCIWEQRNLIVFKDGVPDADEIFQNSQMQSWLWLKHQTADFSYGFSDWILNPNQCLFVIC